VDEKSMNLFETVILGAFAKLRKATIIFVKSVPKFACVSVRPSFRKEKLGSRWTYFKNSIFKYFLETFEKIQFLSDLTRITLHPE
jgi:hypothetical protein